MKRSKPKQAWPEETRTGRGQETTDEYRSIADEHGTAESEPRQKGKEGRSASRCRPKGSYCLQRGLLRLVRSVYLIRVLEHLRDGYRESGDRFLSNLALVWTSSDGSRETSLKGEALRELAQDAQPAPSGR